jgi:hypothetical protein
MENAWFGACLRAAMHEVHCYSSKLDAAKNNTVSQPLTVTDPGAAPFAKARQEVFWASQACVAC